MTFSPPGEVIPGMRRRAPDAAIRTRMIETIAACPAENLLDLRVDDSGRGWLTLSLGVPSDRCAPAEGNAAELCLLADAALGRAIMTELAPDITCRTVDLRLDCTGVGVAKGDVLYATSTRVSRSGRFALATAEITDVNGEILAIATCQLAVVELPGSWSDPAPEGAAERSPSGEAHRSVTTLDSDLEEMAGIDDRLSVHITPGMDTANTSMIVHGGIQAMICDRLAGHLVRARAAGRGAYGLLSLSLQFHRAAPLGQMLTATARITKLGRLVAVADVEVSAGSRILVSGVAIYGNRSVAG